MASIPAETGTSRPRVRTFRDLIVWQRAMELVRASYLLSRHFPARERFGLTDQLRRAVVSVAANIAEGHGRTQRGEYVHHLSIARGSIMEVETLLIVAERMEFAPESACRECLDLTNEVGRMLTALLRALREKSVVRRAGNGD